MQPIIADLTTTILVIVYLVIWASKNTVNGIGP